MGRRSQWGKDLFEQVDQSFTVGLKVCEIMKIVHVAISRHWNFYLQILDLRDSFPVHSYASHSHMYYYLSSCWPCVQDEEIVVSIKFIPPLGRSPLATVDPGGKVEGEEQRA